MISVSGGTARSESQYRVPQQQFENGSLRVMRCDARAVLGVLKSSRMVGACESRESVCCNALRGSERAHGGVRCAREHRSTLCSPPTLARSPDPALPLRAYAMSGTDIAYTAISLRDVRY
eukprot:3085811-Rhodomonas_salina.5